MARFDIFIRMLSKEVPWIDPFDNSFTPPAFPSSCLYIVFTWLLVVITFTSDKYFELLDMGQNRLDENSSIGLKHCHPHWPRNTVHSFSVTPWHSVHWTVCLCIAASWNVNTETPLQIWFQSLGVYWTDHVQYEFQTVTAGRLWVFIYNCYVKKNSHKSCKRKFLCKFPKTCPSRDIISKLVKKVRTHSILINRKPLKRNCVLTEEKLDDIGHRL
jgi:hypothetical protein